MYATPILGLAMMCSTFYLVLSVTLAGLIIVVQGVRVASKKRMGSSQGGLNNEAMALRSVRDRHSVLA